MSIETRQEHGRMRGQSGECPMVNDDGVIKDIAPTSATLLATGASGMKPTSSTAVRSKDIMTDMDIMAASSVYDGYESVSFKSKPGNKQPEESEALASEDTILSDLGPRMTVSSESSETKNRNNSSRSSSSCRKNSWNSRKSSSSSYSSRDEPYKEKGREVNRCKINL